MTSCYIFWVFDMTRRRIEPRSLGPLVNTLTIMPIYIYMSCIYIYIYIHTHHICVCVCMYCVCISIYLSIYVCVCLSIYLSIYIYSKVKLATIVEGDSKAPFSIATTPRCRGGRYSIPRIAPLYPWTVPYNAEC